MLHACNAMPGNPSASTFGCACQPVSSRATTLTSFPVVVDTFSSDSCQSAFRPAGCRTDTVFHSRGSRPTRFARDTWAGCSGSCVPRWAAGWPARRRRTRARHIRAASRPQVLVALARSALCFLHKRINSGSLSRMSSSSVSKLTTSMSVRFLTPLTPCTPFHTPKRSVGAVVAESGKCSRSSCNSTSQNRLTLQQSLRADELLDDGSLRRAHPALEVLDRSEGVGVADRLADRL